MMFDVDVDVDVVVIDDADATLNFKNHQFQLHWSKAKKLLLWLVHLPETSMEKEDDLLWNIGYPVPWVHQMEFQA